MYSLLFKYHNCLTTTTSQLLTQQTEANETGDQYVLSLNAITFAGSILFLSGKLTENYRNIPEILIVVLRLRGYKYRLNDKSQDKLYNSLIEMEHSILRTICFQLDVELPYSYILNIGRSLGVSFTVLHLAWGITNELILHAAFSEVNEVSIAVSVLYIATQIVDTDNSKCRTPNWHNMFQVSDEQLLDVLTLINEVMS